MDLGLKGKRVLVTGGTRGIGAAIVDCFLREGARVAFCARDGAQVSAQVRSLQEGGYDVSGAALDVADPTAYGNWINERAQALGGIDVFIPNVSGGSLAGEEGWKRAFDVDLMATVRGCDHVLPHMATSGDGAIVVIASIAGLEDFGSPGAYNTIKAGLVAYASQLGAAGAPHGIRVNCVSPGPIHVPDGFWGGIEREQPDAYSATVQRQPFGRLGLPEEVANGVVFLASPAAKWITRTNLIVDGGFTKRVQF
ncbi:SDR family NAD(P)-dependent oxidoreductase [Kordiimonas aestuarii]|uniref:SDR family NAD(P)-dependent oxidoreductase n=1 Tax=Kordiimonas aestuarii TaxID=1005925 RepID=UPI0021D17ED6|nr:SDR family NAD(P)-dependent oxidoreductase [Kordiimonas aestuarii]